MNALFLIFSPLSSGRVCIDSYNLVFEYLFDPFVLLAVLLFDNYSLGDTLFDGELQQQFKQMIRKTMINKRARTIMAKYCP